MSFPVVEQLVGEALDRLPKWILDVLASVPIVVTGGGHEASAYGLYEGDGVARDEVLDQIVIYGDTLERDFGHDRDLLAAEVERTLRHEVAHHLGFAERGVSDLGL